MEKVNQSFQAVSMRLYTESQSSAETEEVTEENKAENPAPDSGRRSPARKKRKFQGFKEEPYYHFTPTEEIWPSIK